MRTLYEIRKLVDYYKSELEKHGRVFDKPIRVEVFARKTYGTYGQAQIHRNKPYNVIKINQWLKEDKDIINTILHELSHLDTEGIGDHHGPNWRRVARVYGKLFNTDITRTSNKELTINKKYVWIRVLYTDNAPVKHRKPEGLVHRFNNEQTAHNYAKTLKVVGLLKDFAFITEEEANDGIQKWYS